MTDVLEQDLRCALSERAAQLDPEASARLRSHDFRPRRHRIPVPAVGALGAGGLAAGVALLVSLGSAATPAFAGWQATPAPTAPGPVALAADDCGQGLGSPVLTDSRGPYTASIYDDATTSELCLSAAGISISSTSISAATAAIAPGQATGARLSDAGCGRVPARTPTLRLRPPRAAPRARSVPGSPPSASPRDAS